METTAIIDSGEKLSKRSDKEGEKLKNKSKKEDGVDHSSRKKDESEKNKNNNEVNDNSSSNVSEGRNSLNTVYDKGTDQCAASNGEKIIENKTHTIKEEKSTHKKKIQKEDANGRGKEDCEKKKRKKKKKKKGGSCEDESLKSGREDETSKDRLMGKNGVSKADSRSTDSLKTEHITEQTPGGSEKLPDVTNQDPTLDVHVGGNAKETCNERIQDVVVAADVADVPKFKNNEEGGGHCLMDASTALDAASPAETHQGPDAGVEYSEPNVHMQIELATEMHKLEETVELDNSEMTYNATTESTGSDQPDIQDEDSAQMSSLHTIVESDQAAVVVEQGPTGSCQHLSEAGHENPASVGTVMDFTGETGSTAEINGHTDVGTDFDAVDSGECPDDRASCNIDMTQEQLQQKLQEQYYVKAGLQVDTQTQQIKANFLTATLQAKLRGKDQEIRMLKCEHEQHMSAVLSHLLYLEGQMQKEQNHILDILHEKDDIIRRQKAAIEDLVAKNNRYLQALKESHGYSVDNGLVKPQNHIVQENGKVSIQDHGNKVILRGNKNKHGEKVQASGHKVRFSAMKDRLRRHKSSLELYRHEKLETLMETTPKYGSEENLVVDRFGKSSLFDRKERCRSLIDYPVSLFDVEEGLTESPDSCFSEDYTTPTISRNDSTSSLVSFNEKTPWSTAGLPSASAYGFNELSKSRSVPHALPTVAENDGIPAHLRGRPHSLPSVEMLPKDIITTPNSNKPPASTSESNSPATPSTSSSQPSSDSNPFKSFKNVFKRKGSKKKRTPSMTSGNDQTDALKQHFKKYDMT